jgi:hypothetical protein
MGMLIQIKKPLAAEVTDAVQQSQSWPRPLAGFEVTLYGRF